MLRIYPNIGEKRTITILVNIWKRRITLKYILLYAYDQALEKLYLGKEKADLSQKSPVEFSRHKIENEQNK